MNGVPITIAVVSALAMGVAMRRGSAQIAFITDADRRRYDDMAKDFAAWGRNFAAHGDTETFKRFPIGRHIRHIGSGEDRAVFQDTLHPERVIKLNWDEDGSTQNLCEIRVWREAPDVIRAHLVPILAYDEAGAWVVMPRVVPMTNTGEDPDNGFTRTMARCGLGDLHAENLSTDWKILDYGWIDLKKWVRCAKHEAPAGVV